MDKKNDIFHKELETLRELRQKIQDAIERVEKKLKGLDTWSRKDGNGDQGPRK